PPPRSTLFPYTTLFRSVNAEVPHGALLYYVSPYYDGVAEGIYQGAGLLRPDLRIRYAKSLPDFGPLPDGAWIFSPEKISRHPGRSEEHTSELQSPCNLV